MNVSSNYSNYYASQLYSPSSLSNNKKSTTTSSSDSSTSSALESLVGKINSTISYENAMSLSMSGKMLKYAMESQKSATEKSPDEMKAQMDEFKNADITSMTADEVQQTLVNLQSDLTGMPNPDEEANNVINANITSMSETDMRSMLTSMQEHIKSMPEPGKGQPPMGGAGMPPMTGVNTTQDLATLLGTDSTEEDIQSYFQKLVDNLTSSYDKSTETSDEYADKLKESLTAMFTQQKSNIDTFSQNLFNQLDAWSQDNTAV